MDRIPRTSDRCQRIIDLIDACLAEHGVAPRPVQDAPVARRRSA